MSARPNNLTPEARARAAEYHRDRSAKPREMVLRLLSPEKAKPLSDVVAEFHVAAMEAGMAAGWNGSIDGVVRGLLATLEKEGRAVLVAFTASGVRRDDPAWALPPFVAPLPQLATRLRTKPIAASSIPAGKSVAIAMMKKEIAEVREETRARLNRMEAQLAAMEASAGRTE